MGWFSDAFDFAGGGGGGWLGPVIGGAALVGGALISADANRDAARMASRAAERAADEERRAAGEARAILDRLVETYEPARDLLMERALRDPASLTPGQQRSLADLARSSEAATAATGLRGSGRSRLALMDELLGGARAHFYDINRASADQATDALADMGVRGIAGQAAVTSGEGAATADALMRGGEIGAGARTATGSVWGRTLGDLGGLLAESVKERERKKRFEDGMYRMAVPV